MPRKSSKPVLTYAIAHAAGMDAGNRSMRAAGREKWNEDDYDAACDETNRLLDLIGYMPERSEGGADLLQ